MTNYKFIENFSHFSHHEFTKRFWTNLFRDICHSSAERCFGGKTRRKVLKVAIERAKVEKSIVDLSWLSISVNCLSHLKVDLSRKSISVERRSQSKDNLSRKTISVERRSYEWWWIMMNDDEWWYIMNDLMMFWGFGHSLTNWLTHSLTDGQR